VWILSRGKVVERGANGAAVRMVGTRMDISARKVAEAEIAQLAFYDGLTGLPNRRLLLDRLTLALAKSARREQRGAVLFVDLGNFKSLNDTLGQDMGDRLLTLVASRLRQVTRETDTVARLGGDEFVILLEAIGHTAEQASSHAELVAAKVLHVLRQTYPLDSHQLHSTPSIGLVLFGAGAHTLEDLLKQADMAMYEAKAAGRNTYRFFDPCMQEAADRSARLESELRRALKADQFHLFYQPVVDADGRILGAEALVRWQHPRDGLIGPATFIAQAEKSELILSIGDWVLETACRQLAVWAGTAASATLSIAVNISARQVRRPDFVEHVMRMLGRTGADPVRLKLELTESILLGDVDDMIAKMSALRAVGVAFSLDDFGTGYSSLSYLKKLPLDQLKIDQSFVHDMLTAPNAATIVRTIITLAHSLGLDVSWPKASKPQRSGWHCARAAVAASRAICLRARRRSRNSICCSPRPYHLQCQERRVRLAIASRRDKCRGAKSDLDDDGRQLRVAVGPVQFLNWCDVIVILTSSLGQRWVPILDTSLTQRTSIMKKLLLAGVVGALCSGFASAAATNVVLVHGAYADGSSWNDVVARLQKAGMHVTSVQNPLTSLADDVAATRRVLALQDGPTVLVGHSWAGTVISEAGTDPKVGALVYVAARAPDADEDYGALAAKFPVSPASAGLVRSADGFAQLSEAAFVRDFAGDIDPSMARVLYAGQGRISQTLFNGRTTQAAWKVKPTYYAISTNDRTTSPDLERFLARRMGAETIELASGHLSMISHPDQIANLILKAARAVK
jgi:diguanylate cyclase (GGDEF)-like protein